jgi:hypothetical protein
VVGEKKHRKAIFFFICLSLSRGNVVWKEIGHRRLHSPCTNCPFDVFCDSYAVYQLNVTIQQAKNYDRQQMLRSESRNGPTVCRVSPTSLIRFFPNFSTDMSSPVLCHHWAVLAARYIHLMRLTPQIDLYR